MESLIKPEEILQPDEDLDDVEGEMAFLGMNSSSFPSFTEITL